jgi:hypothetical protein
MSRVMTVLPTLAAMEQTFAKNMMAQEAGVPLRTKDLGYRAFTLLERSIPKFKRRKEEEASSLRKLNVLEF